MLKVSTKTGDKGETSLANGERLEKDDLIFDLIGTLDELNSFLGLVRSQLNDLLKVDQDDQLFHHEKVLFSIQNQIFSLGGYAAGAKVRLSEDFLEKLEKETDDLQELMDDDWHSCFVLPGGHLIAAHLDVSRSVCRRLERIIVKYSKEYADVDDLLLKIINRLSDYLYVLRCFVNEKQEVIEQYV
jgi:cob(I)alamin adenosyltransferase